jgi:CubicO group peptidase (beta-lactamase class C family)
VCLRIGIGLTFAALLLLAALAPAHTPISSSIDSIFAPLAGSGSPGAAVLVRSHGRTVFERGYGVRDLRTRTRIDSVTCFRLASLSKQFTALAVMLLVHDRKLQYESKLTDIFAEFPAYGRAITIRQLLTHTSGLPDYENLMEAPGSPPRWTASNQIHDGEVLDLLKRQPACKFPPGTSWSYSNSGYVMLGLIVARVSGMPFERFLHERIFEPLHMTGTLVFVNGENEVPNRAYGHIRGLEGFSENDQSSTSATQGDGGVYSNVADLAKWDDALETHALLSAEEMKPALIPAVLAGGAQPRWPVTPGEDNLAPGKPVVYGFGWFLDPWRGHARMWHFGSTSGFRAAIHRFSSDRLTVVVLCNRTDLDAGRYALEVTDLLLRGK